jgi:hypothetical protein
MNSTTSESMSLEISKSAEMATTLPLSTIAHLQRCVGKTFEVSATGLTIVPGASVSQTSLSSLISFLGVASEQGKIATGLINLALGDAIILTRQAFGDQIADELIVNATRERGQSKHTVQEAERTVQFINEVFPDRNDRPSGLTYTHWNLVKSYARTKDGGEVKRVILDEKVKEIIGEVVKGKVVSNIQTKEGENRETRIPLSCAETKTLLLEAAPREAKPKKGGKLTEEETKEAFAKRMEIKNDGSVLGEDSLSNETPTECEVIRCPRFLYVSRTDMTDAAFSREDEVDLDFANEDYIIYDLFKKEVLDPDQSAIAEITEL